MENCIPHRFWAQAENCGTRITTGSWGNTTRFMFKIRKCGSTVVVCVVCSQIQWAVLCATLTQSDSSLSQSSRRHICVYCFRISCCLFYLPVQLNIIFSNLTGSIWTGRWCTHSAGVKLQISRKQKRPLSECLAVLIINMTPRDFVSSGGRKRWTSTLLRILGDEVCLLACFCQQCLKSVLLSL